MAKIQLKNLLELATGAVLLQLQAFFLDDIETNNAQVANIITNETGNVVITNQQ